jgi:hypothetical protein
MYILIIILIIFILCNYHVYNADYVPGCRWEAGNAEYAQATLVSTLLTGTLAEGPQSGGLQPGPMRSAVFRYAHLQYTITTTFLYNLRDYL